MIESHAHAPQPSPFSDAEWEELRRQDAVAGTMVGGLMAIIFAIGLVIYSIVYWTTVS
jgi:hypothetical protein